jgi:acetyl esterase/lipase
MKTILVTVLLFMAVSVQAQKPIEIPLWPNGTPNTNGLKGEEENGENGRVSNILKPDITVYCAYKPNGMAIIMCPGGGYARLAMDHEGHDMASWFNAQGITYIVLKYRMPNGHNEVPLSDAEQAIRLVRQHAAEWKINPSKVGIMGASAGGHLASTLATHYSSKETRPDFQILLYPVVTMNASYTHGGSRENLITKTPTTELEKKYSNELQVTAETPQAFITLSSDDKGVPPQNSVNYYLALLKNNVPATMHIYPTGGHGWGFRDNFIYKRQWTGELEKWLRDGVKL